MLAGRAAPNAAIGFFIIAVMGSFDARVVAAQHQCLPLTFWRMPIS